MQAKEQRITEVKRQYDLGITMAEEAVVTLKADGLSDAQANGVLGITGKTLISKGVGSYMLIPLT